MIGWESVVIALQGLLANRLRSALTILGMLIGVASVIVLIAVGNGSQAAVQSRIEALGTNVLLVMPPRSIGGRRSNASSQLTLTMADATALQNSFDAPDIESATPIVEASPTITFDGTSYSPSSFLGATPTIFTARSYKPASGTFFTNADVTNHNRVLVIGQTVVTNLFGGANPVGQTVQIGGDNFTVVAVTQAKGSNGTTDQDDVAIAPITAVEDSLTGFGSISEIIVQAKSESALNAASAEVTGILDGLHHLTSTSTSNFTVINQGSLLQTSSATTSVFTTLLGEVAAISLLVGGIGVMNIMLVTVTERTREIGIRKAIGARKTDILSQFIIEAVLVSVLGGIAGVIVGLVTTQFTIAGVQPIPSAGSVGLAFGAAVVVGLFFGTYPASRAASLRPIDALRYE